MLGQVEVLLRDEHALAEELLVDLLAVFLGDQPGSVVSVISSLYICACSLTSCRWCWACRRCGEVVGDYVKF